MKGLSRRDALRLAALGAAGAASRTTSASATPPRAGLPNMHLSLAAYSLRQDLRAGRRSLFDFIDWCAELGLPGAELTSYFFEEGFDAAYLRRLRRHAFDAGVTVSGTAIRNEFCRPPGPERDAEVDAVKTWIDHAAELWAPHIRIFAGTLPDGASRSAGIRWVADAIREVLPHAEAQGVVVGLENHGGITARAADHLAICDAVGEHPYFGVNLDTGNYRTDSRRELAMAAPRAVNVQVKVEEWKDGEQVAADLGWIRDMLVDADYRGWVALEYEASEDPYAAIPRYVAEMKRLFESQVG